MSLTLKQKVELGNYIATHTKGSVLSNARLAKTATEALGFPIPEYMMRRFRIELGFKKQERVKGTKLEQLLARVDLLEKRVANLEQHNRFQGLVLPPKLGVGIAYAGEPA